MIGGKNIFLPDDLVPDLMKMVKQKNETWGSACEKCIPDRLTDYDIQMSVRDLDSDVEEDEETSMQRFVVAGQEAEEFDED